MSTANTVRAPAETDDNYRYKRFTTGLLFRDMSFGKEAAKPGDSFPAFELTTTGGDRLLNNDSKGSFLNWQYQEIVTHVQAARDPRSSSYGFGPVSVPPASTGSSARHSCRPFDKRTAIPVVSLAVMRAICVSPICKILSPDHQARRQIFKF